MSETKPFWWPEPINAEWRARIGADYPEDTEGMNDEDIDDTYAEGWRYDDTWDHLGDAREQYQYLADAFLKLVAETGKTPEYFDE